MARRYEQKHLDPANPYPLARPVENEPLPAASGSGWRRRQAERWWARPPDFPGEEPPLDQTSYWYQLHGGA